MWKIWEKIRSTKKHQEVHAGDKSINYQFESVNDVYINTTDTQAGKKTHSLKDMERHYRNILAKELGYIHNDRIYFAEKLL